MRRQRRRVVIERRWRSKHLTSRDREDAIVANADGAVAQPRTALPILPSAPYQPVNVAYRIGIRGVDGYPEN